MVRTVRRCSLPDGSTVGVLGEISPHFYANCRARIARHVAAFSWAECDVTLLPRKSVVASARAHSWAAVRRGAATVAVFLARARRTSEVKVDWFVVVRAAAEAADTVGVDDALRAADVLRRKTCPQARTLGSGATRWLCAPLGAHSLSRGGGARQHVVALAPLTRRALVGEAFCLGKLPEGACASGKSECFFVSRATVAAAGAGRARSVSRPRRGIRSPGAAVRDAVRLIVIHTIAELSEIAVVAEHVWRRPSLSHAAEIRGVGSVAQAGGVGEAAVCFSFIDFVDPRALAILWRVVVITRSLVSVRQTPHAFVLRAPVFGGSYKDAVAKNLLHTRGGSCRRSNLAKGFIVSFTKDTLRARS